MAPDLSVLGCFLCNGSFSHHVKLYVYAQDFHPEEVTGLCAKYINGKTDRDEKRWTSKQNCKKIQNQYKKKFKKIQSIKKIQNYKWANLLKYFLFYSVLFTYIAYPSGSLAVYIFCKLKGQIQRTIMFQFRSINLFHFYLLFIFSFTTHIFSH